MKTFASEHPEFGTFGGWAKSAPWTGSYAEEPYNSLNSFVFTDNSGAEHVVRWSLHPEATVVPITQDELAKRGPDILEQEITQRVAAGPQHWTMTVTVANPGDPTADPSKAWPADRRTIEVGKLTVDKIEAERDGPCREINFDPTVLPNGIKTSDDPFPAARSSAYAKSYDPPHGRSQGLPPHHDRSPSHDRGPSTLHPASAASALAHGGLHSGYAVHRRRHGLHDNAEVSDAGFDP